MPTILFEGPYRFFFYSNEYLEQPHIHVQSGNKLAKFWIEPVSFASSTRFPAHELRKIEKIIENNSKLFIEAWNEHFNN